VDVTWNFVDPVNSLGQSCGAWLQDLPRLHFVNSIAGDGTDRLPKVTALAKALQEPGSRSEATEALRGLVDAIVLTPD